MNLVWKLLRQHISFPQFAGFLLANLSGMLVVLFGCQFYNDVLPVFTRQDTFLKSDYLVISKRIGMSTTLSGSDNTFTEAEADDLARQSFSKRVGRFTSVEYKVDATMGIQGQDILNSEIFLESVPDEFVDAPMAEWKFDSLERSVPVVLPQSYINVYNFGFAGSHSLPKISSGLASAVNLAFHIHTREGKAVEYHGRVIGFSNRLNTILVPQSFVEWSNRRFAAGMTSRPDRLLLEVSNPADDAIAQYIDKHGYEVDSDKLDAGKTTFFLRLIVGLVMAVGIVIVALAFYILLLSIYLLVQKNSEKLDNLLLIGYSPKMVAFPYQCLTAVLNGIALLAALGMLLLMRQYYLGTIYQLFPDLSEPSMLPSICLALSILTLVTLLNSLVIRRKIGQIWKNGSR
ncbi:MAG: ABC transporter permease [Prevotella sp.]